MKITKQGKHAINAFISEITAKRKEILDARRDTANETTLPNMEDIICDIPNFTDSDGDYINGWGVHGPYGSCNSFNCWSRFLS